MASNNLKQLVFSFKRRTAPAHGGFQSAYFNDTSSEIAVDLSTLASEWNNKLYKMCLSLPDGSVDTSVNAFTKGLDGKNCWVDASATSSSTEPRFYFTSKGRPYTIAELFQYTWSYIDSSVEGTSTSNPTTLPATPSGTDSQKIADIIAILQGAGLCA